VQREHFVEKITREAPFASKDQAEAAVRCVFEAIAQVVEKKTYQPLLAEIPRDYAAVLQASATGAGDADAFYAHIAAAEGAGEGFAREHAAVILQALAREISAEARKALHDGLPADVARLLDAPWERKATPSHRTPASAHGHLAGARPGSAHPVSEASADRAQSDSIAATDAPHADSSVAAGHSTSADSNLASGKPGSGRPINEGK
jgi:uncharacterized protein (DUF2267 family)